MASVPCDASRGLARGPRVLLVEDDRAIREVVCVVLTEEGYHVEHAERPEIALEALSRGAYDLVLTDLFGPTLADGLDAVRPLVASAAPTPVGVCSGHDVTLEQARAAGLAFVLPKPFELDQLLDCLATQLSA